MRDHFREFLIPKHNPAVGYLGQQAPFSNPSLGHADKAPLKTHLLWAAVVTGTAFMSWKASEWHAHYKLGKAGKLR